MSKSPKHRRLPLYGAYTFKGDEKDPVIDVVHTALEDAGLNYNQASINSGVSASTIREWIEGKTKRPQFCTIAAVMKGAGYENRWTKVNGIGHNSRRTRTA